VATIAFVSFRLGGTDGVAIEVEKWRAALELLGHRVYGVAGEGSAEVIIPGLAISAMEAPEAAAVEHAVAGADLVIVENMGSLPLNPAARDVLHHIRRGKPTLFHHHDLPWQRPHLAHLDGPSHDDAWAHVVINELSQRDLAERGIAADLIYNHFDCDPPRGDRHRTRQALGITNERLFVLPTRAIPRKNVAGALTLAEACGATLWLLGPPEDGYDDELTRLVAATSAPVLRGPVPNTTIHDVYAASDLVVMPSTWEGFGNPVLESVTHQRPLALHWYPVALEIAAFGFRFLGLDDVDAIVQELTEPDHDTRAHNVAIARQHFSLSDLPTVLDDLLRRHFPGLRR